MKATMAILLMFGWTSAYTAGDAALREAYCNTMGDTASLAWEMKQAGIRQNQFWASAGTLGNDPHMRNAIALVFDLPHPTKEKAFDTAYSYCSKVVLTIR